MRNVKSLRGDRELRRQLALPKDFCTPLALETNGTVFDLKKMTAGQQPVVVKKFIDILARRVAVTGEPSACQRCDCIGDRDGVGTVLCQRCVSPVLERLDKVRSLYPSISISSFIPLIYQNKTINQSHFQTTCDLLHSTPFGSYFTLLMITFK